MQKAEGRKQRHSGRLVDAVRSAVYFLPSASCRLLPAFCLLLSAFCLLAFGQPGAPQPNSPLYGAAPSIGQASNGLPKILQNVGIDQRLNEQIPLDAVFKDEQGREVKLGEFFGKKPVVLSL